MGTKNCGIASLWGLTTHLRLTTLLAEAIGTQGGLQLPGFATSCPTESDAEPPPPQARRDAIPAAFRWASLKVPSNTRLASAGSIDATDASSAVG
eukprot:CAMPEP_0177572880 /NCGR_PEP_ID=MMETSP0369-20130122/78244_1 /TAXON_ID=447022 ORGANISM="Scrippsiella hangoei-like, Strain SHHI-4" /NCGR_SAMPLE_ID=MMETSP0369 /ASSEMBLY_ACC=CAM_ASM_000364 /LENGTH=94 /DNA_ID=CAMNT_0019060983 /DNA_START=139 /DNA_END=420 /DNA_ORIENTATION=-